MSSPPPPPPGYVPAGPPPPPAEVRPPARWIKPAYVIGAIAVVVALAVVLLVVLTGDDEPNGPDTKAAAAVLQRFEDTTELERDTFHLVDACVLGDVDGVIDAAPAGLDLEIDADAARSQGVGVTGRASDPWLHSCNVGESTGGVTVLVSLAPPGDYRKWIERTLPEATVTFDDDERDGAATVVSYCLVFDGQESGSCEADWTDGVISLGVAVARDDVDHDLLRSWVLAVRDQIIALVEGADVEAVTVSTLD